MSRLTPQTKFATLHFLRFDPTKIFNTSTTVVSEDELLLSRKSITCLLKEYFYQCCH